MSDYSSLYPTLTRKNSPGTGSGSASGSTSSLGSLDSVWDPDGNFTGETNITGDFSSKGGFNYGKLASGLAPLALSLFAPHDGPSVTGAIGDATTAAKTLGKTGANLGAQGSEVLTPILHHLAAVASGDPMALMQATMPERRKVIDQYDTARQAAQFSPRGGGTSSAIVNANTREAGDLAAIGSKATSDATQIGAQVGAALTGQGANAESASVGHLTQLLEPLMRNQAADQNSIFNTFSSIASLIGMFV